MNILESNQVLADFMELPKQDASNGGNHFLYEHPITGEYVSYDQLRYEESIEWLWPVMLKIEDIQKSEEFEKFVFSIVGTVVKIMRFSTKGPILTEYISAVADTKFQAVYEACYQFALKHQKHELRKSEASTSR